MWEPRPYISKFFVCLFLLPLFHGSVLISSPVLYNWPLGSWPSALFVKLAIMQTLNKNVYVTCIDLLSQLPVSSPHLLWISKFFMSTKVPAQHSSAKICYKHLASYASSKVLKLIIRLSTKYYIKSTHILLNTAENRLHNCSPFKKNQNTILGKNRKMVSITCHNMTTQVAVFVRWVHVLFVHTAKGSDFLYQVQVQKSEYQ